MIIINLNNTAYSIMRKGMTSEHLSMLDLCGMLWDAVFCQLSNTSQRKWQIHSDLQWSVRCHVVTSRQHWLNWQFTQPQRSILYWLSRLTAVTLMTISQCIDTLDENSIW